MLRYRLSQQDADPIGGIAAAPIVVVASVLTLAASIALTIWHASEISSGLAAVLGIVLVAAAGITAAVSTAPSRAPFTIDRLGVVVTLGVGAAIAEYVSTLGADEFLYDNYGPLVIGVLILALAPYCSWVSLVTVGVVASAVLAILATGSGVALAGDAGDARLVSRIAVNTVAVIALTAAAAAYSYAIVGETLAWQRQANTAALQRDAEMRAGIARSVQQGRVSVLGREVLPFLAGIMTADRVTVADADRARELADALRGALKAGIESTWLDDLAASITAVRGVAVHVDDPGGVAGELRSDERSTLTALVSWMSTAGRCADIDIAFRTRERASRRAAARPADRPADRAGHRAGVIVVSARAGEAPPTRRDLERFIAVARSVGMRADIEITRETVEVEFHHDLE